MMPMLMLEEITNTMRATGCYFEFRAYETGLLFTCVRYEGGKKQSISRSLEHQVMALFTYRDYHALIHMMVKELLE